MKLRAATALLLAGVATWMLFRSAWAALGLGLLAVSWLALPVAVWRRAEGRAALSALVLYFGLGSLALVWLLALIVGPPTTLGFWVVFGGALLVVGPVLWLGKRVMLGKAVG
jgi:hypothetical protein